MLVVPKYSQPEIERRWLVERDKAAWVCSFLSFRLIEDRYILGTRLRLRKVTGEESQFKLGKKYGPPGTEAEPVVSVYLTEEEFHILAVLPAHIIHKRRFAVSGGSVNQYLRRSDDLFIFEAEFPSLSEAQAYIAPEFVSAEITGVEKYSGFNIARVA